MSDPLKAVQLIAERIAFRAPEDIFPGDIWAFVYALTIVADRCPGWVAMLPSEDWILFHDALSGPLAAFQSDVHH